MLCRSAISAEAGDIAGINAISVSWHSNRGTHRTLQEAFRQRQPGSIGGQAIIAPKSSTFLTITRVLPFKHCSHKNTVSADGLFAHQGYFWRFRLHRSLAKTKTTQRPPAAAQPLHRLPRPPLNKDYYSTPSRIPATTPALPLRHARSFRAAGYLVDASTALHRSRCPGSHAAAISFLYHHAYTPP